MSTFTHFLPDHAPATVVLSVSYRSLALVSCILALVWRIVIPIYAESKRRKQLPPGPKGQYVLGVTKEMLDDSIKPWIRFDRWSREYNAPHLLYVPTLGQDSIIINSMQAAIDLLEKRPKIYSGRPRNVFDVEIVERSLVLANIDEPEAVAKRRKLLNEDLGAQGSRNAQPVQTNEAVKFCADMLAHPTEYTSVITRSQHSLVLCMTFAALSHHTYEQLWAHVDATQARPKPALTPLLNIYPWMRFLPNWIPGCNFYEIGEKYHQTDKALWTGVISDVREGLAIGKPAKSVVAKWLESDASRRYGFNDVDLAFAAGNLLTAGGDLPDVTLRIFILAMLHHPKICAKAQAEIDALCGRERLPQFEDKDSLPYTRAVILETQRWRPLTPIGVCHTATEDDWYDGMYIPKGARFFPSLWEMSQDESVYPSPEIFRPERHLREDGSFTKRAELPTWGFGARKCSAMHLAEGTLFINIVMLLWAFDFVAPIDANGNRILPSAAYEDWIGVLPCTPPKFEVTCSPRGPEVEQLLRADLDAHSS